MNQYKGIAEIEILGEKRGFKFGMGAFAHVCKIEQVDIGVILDKVIKGDLPMQLLILYAAAVQYARLNKIKEPTQEEVNDWVDHYGFDKMAVLISEAFKVNDPNAEAPKEGQ